jgi:uncharacterized repeat protein (TIGR01451 family)
MISLKKMVSLNRRKSVMGNGGWSGRSMGKSSGSSLLWPRLFVAMLVLLLAGSVLLGLGSRRSAQKALAPVPPFSIPASSGSFSSRSSVHPRPNARAILGNLPLIFEPNQGQADPGVKFLARGAGYSLFLDPTSAVLAFQTAPSSQSGHNEHFVRMKLVGANPAAATAGTDPLPGKSNYLIGNDPHQWHSGVPQFAGVHYANVYPGIDLVYYGNQGRLEYDFRVAPGADPAQAELQFEGARKLQLSGGDLILTGKNEGGLRLQAPRLYQRDGDRKEPVAGRFVLRAANRVGFEIGPYDRSRELVIDPSLDFSTYFGGNGTETSPSVAVNGDGFIYLVGSTTSTPSSFPIGTLATTQIGTAPNIFVVKISPALPPSVVYLTFIGGSGGPGADTSIGLGVDGGGQTYIVGNTSSNDFPTSGTNILGYQTAPETKGPQCAGITCTSVFVSVLNALGTGFNYSSYLSGNGNDQASGMTIDTQGDVFVTGTTSSTDTPSLTDAFPATNLPVPYQAQPSPGSTIQFFVTKVDTSIPSVDGIAYSTYFGGGTPTTGVVATGGGIAVDSPGNIYFTGTTNMYNSGSGVFGNSGLSVDFPILNAYQACLDTAPQTIVPPNPNPCSPPPPPAPYPTDAFVAKINPLGQAGTQLIFSTYLGGSGTDSGTGIAIDYGAANIYLTGTTNSSNFVLPTAAGAYDSCLNNGNAPGVATPCATANTTNTDAFVARLGNPSLSTTGIPNFVQLNYFSYLGGSGNDTGLAIAVLDASSTTLDDVAVTGATSSTNFPVTSSALQSQFPAGATQTAFLAQIDTTTVTGQNQLGSYVTYFGGNNTSSGTSIAVDPNLNTYLAGVTTSNGGTFETDNPLPGPGGSSLSGTSDAFVVKLGTASDLTFSAAPVYSETGVVSGGNPLTVTFTITNNGPDPATGITVTGSVSSGVTFNSATAGGGSCSAPVNNAVVCQIPALQAGSISPVAFTVTPNGTCTSCSVTASVFNSNNTNTSNNTISAPFNAGGYSLQINPSSQPVTAGQPAHYTVQVSPTNGVFLGNVALTCSALPAGAACSFTNSTVSLANGPQAVGLNLTTTAQPVNNPQASAGWRRSLYALWLMPGMAVFGLGLSSKRRGKRGRLLGLLFGLSVLFALVALQPSCSSAKTQPTVSGTPSGTYFLTVTGTSGSLSISKPFSLTVIP